MRYCRGLEVIYLPGDTVEYEVVIAYKDGSWFGQMSKELIDELLTAIKTEQSIFIADAAGMLVIPWPSIHSMKVEGYTSQKIRDLMQQPGPLKMPFGM